MYYIVQENVFREPHYDILIKCLERAGLEYEVIKVIPFVDTIEFKTDRKDVFVFGSLKLARIGVQYGWNPGSFMDDNHNYLNYSKYYKENLLNYDSKIYRFNEEFAIPDPMFIRPCADSKAFTAKVYDKYEWEECREYNLYNGHTTVLNKDTEIQVSTPKQIQKEIRFWVVDGKVVTGSQYRLGNQTLYDEFYEPEAKEFAQRMVDIYQLAKAFVMDVCLVNDEWKIVELNCINCSGFYKGDMLKLLDSLELAFGDTKMIQ